MRVFLRTTLADSGNAGRLVKISDPGILIDKLNAEEGVGDIARRIFYVTYVNSAAAEELTRNPGIENPENNMELENDIEKIGTWIGQIDWAAGELADELIPLVNKNC